MTCFSDPEFLASRLCCTTPVQAITRWYAITDADLFSEEYPRGHREFDAAVYELMCVGTGESYIGCSMNVWARTSSHRSAIQSGRHQLPAIRRVGELYGADGFRVRLLETCCRAGRMKAEKRWIALLRPALNGLIVLPGQRTMVGRNGKLYPADKSRPPRPTLSPIGFVAPTCLVQDLLTPPKRKGAK